MPKEMYRVVLGDEEVYRGASKEEARQKFDECVRRRTGGSPAVAMFDETDYSDVPKFWDLGEGDVAYLDVGETKVVDGLAAGCCWQQLEFVYGRHKGKKVNFCLDRSRPDEATYYPAVVSDDGFQVNGEDFPGDLPWKKERVVRLFGIVKKEKD